VPLFTAQAQCITHFLRLNIEDDFLDELEHSGRDGDAAPGGVVESGAAGQPVKMPFADDRNPIMSLVCCYSADRVVLCPGGAILD